MMDVICSIEACLFRDLLGLGWSVTVFQALLASGDEFLHTVSEKLLTYALGRGVDYYDQPTLSQMVRDLEENDYRWSSLVLAVAQSDPFQMRRASDEVTLAQ